MDIAYYLEKAYRFLARYGINKKNRKRLINRNVSIIASNCIGGMIYHDMNLRFLSPTINAYFIPSDFIRFCRNLRYYLSIDPEPVDTNSCSYPMAKLDDILIHCVHYTDFEEFRNKWNERKRRVDFANMAFIMFERDGCTYEDIAEFDALEYKNKVVIVSREMPEFKSSIYLPGMENPNNDRHKVKDLTAFETVFSGHRRIDRFDYVSFLNSGKIRLSNRYWR